MLNSVLLPYNRDGSVSTCINRSPEANCSETEKPIAPVAIKSTSWWDTAMKIRKTPIRMQQIRLLRIKHWGLNLVERKTPEKLKRRELCELCFSFKPSSKKRCKIHCCQRCSLSKYEWFKSIDTQSGVIALSPFLAPFCEVRRYQKWKFGSGKIPQFHK